MKQPNKWVQFTKRTNDPKLRWLESKLAQAGIDSRRQGESFHAPILQVRQKDLDAAWAILTPWDDIPDDDPRWGIEENYCPSCGEYWKDHTWSTFDECYM